MRNEMCRWVRGLRLCDPYNLWGTMFRLLLRNCWKGMSGQTKQSNTSCIHGNESEDRNPKKKPSLKDGCSTEGFSNLACDVETTTHRARRRKPKVLVPVDDFSTYVRVKEVQDERAETKARTYMERRILVFALMEFLFLERRLEFSEQCGKEFDGIAGTGKIQA